MIDVRAMEAERLLRQMKDRIVGLSSGTGSSTVVQLRPVHLRSIEWMLDLVGRSEEWREAQRVSDDDYEKENR